MATSDASAAESQYAAIGLDMGGSSIKYALVDAAGKLVESTFGQATTPDGAHPDAVAQVMSEIIGELQRLTGEELDGIPAGVTVPGVVIDGVVHTAANIDEAWIGLDATAMLGQVLGREVSVLNDADAAGMAEVYAGAGSQDGRPIKGSTLLLTLGTGIGSAFFRDGVLFPNVEFGHLEIDGFNAESKAAARVMREENLNWEQYIARLQRYLSHVEFLCSPDLIVIGGAISEDHEQFLPQLKLRAKLVPAEYNNAAGVLGAAHRALHSGT
ncbi:polyphosphate glucokinase [Arthrobacter sp. MYb224]|uniref:polyphosphate--glucose phosphotransferase n=1 Tax=Arthrobacter sp. MYb224 TaxID=1848600 RepID=UPI000CFDDA06|nr:ROK family protein [Arthrobacter sp. MYb224]PQZ96823.1 polyphosphate glucokinase [Arthrobacter sp. MYb224]